ncbi:hypothetical protein MO867_07385 [Microbulbifer sp. OS29]|uniref:Uncharacterized protein n=1 Tax=Microbulbifer okhotskensis TaxID=2926617 RepID=A0A9X2EM85_9GAMM|nr:hypothetical protein [Microbulbifer okhotskensis]MCO1334165.1 hypothetical protein [Microbulbifer okhotskensis]
MDWLNEAIDKKIEKERNEKAEWKLKQQRDEQERLEGYRSAAKALNNLLPFFTNIEETLKSKGLSGELSIGESTYVNTKETFIYQLSIVIDGKVSGNKNKPTDIKNEINFSVKYDQNDKKIKIYAKYSGVDPVKIISQTKPTHLNPEVVEKEAKDYFQKLWSDDT